MFPAILGVLVSINLLRTEGTVVLRSLLLMRSLIRSLVKFFPKDLALHALDGTYRENER